MAACAGEVEQVGDSFERVVDFVGDGAGEAADGGELFGLQEGLLGELAVGDVDADDDDAGDGVVGFAEGLVDEVEVAELERAGGAAGELDGGAVAEEGLAGGVDVVEQGEEALAFGFGDGFANGFAEDVALADEVEVEGVGELEDVVRAARAG